MSIRAYLYFNGNCREALSFYEQVFKTEKYMVMTYGDAPKDPAYEVPEEIKNLVIHARLNIDDSVVMFSDTFPGGQYTKGNNVTLSYISSDVEAIKFAYEKLKEGGLVQQELQETFWSRCYGSLTDKYGVSWQLSYEEEI